MSQASPTAPGYPSLRIIVEYSDPNILADKLVEALKKHLISILIFCYEFPDKPLVIIAYNSIIHSE